MVIEISNYKYMTGSNIGYDKVERPGILAKLNAVIEWDFCRFPPLGKDKSPDDPDKEDKEFLGADPELKVGSVFKLGNQLLAIDSPDSIVLVMSETGVGGLRRVLDEIVDPELNLMFNCNAPNSVKMEKAEIDDVPIDSWEFHNIPYTQAKIWRDRFIEGRPEYPERGLVLKLEMDSDSFIFPIHLYLLDWGFWWNPMEMDATEDDEELKLCTNELMKWFYDNFPRKERPMEFKRADAEKAARLENMKKFLEYMESQNQDGGEGSTTADPSQQQNP